MAELLIMAKNNWMLIRQIGLRNKKMRLIGNIRLVTLFKYFLMARLKMVKHGAILRFIC